METTPSSSTGSATYLFNPQLDLLPLPASLAEFQLEIQAHPDIFHDRYQLMAAAINEARHLYTHQAREIQELETNLTAVRDEAQQYTQDLVAAQAINQALRDTTHTLRQASEKPRLSEKYPDPDYYEGNKHDLPRFKTHCRIKLNANADRYPTEASKVQYIQGRLKGKAYDQVYPHVRNDGTVDFDTAEKLLEYLESAFGDSDKVRNAQRSLLALRQKNRPFSEYYAEFQRLAPETGFNDAAKLSALLEGLSVELKTVAAYRDMPDSLQDIIPVLQKSDNQLRALAQTNSSRTTNSIHRPSQPTIPKTPATTVVTTPSPAVTVVPSGDPMDLSNYRSRTAKLTEQERSYRFTKGLCLYCGDAGHKVNACPKSKASQRPTGIRLREVVFTGEESDTSSAAGGVDVTHHESGKA